MNANEKLEALRRDFDQAFALPARQEDGNAERLIVLRLGASRLAVRVAELGGLFAMPAIVPLPGGPVAWRGLASLQGELVAVFDLAGLIGAAAGGQPRWLSRAAADPSIALAFDEVETFHLVPAGAIVPAAPEQASTFVSEFLTSDATAIGILSLEAVVAAIPPSAGPAGI